MHGVSLSDLTDCYLVVALTKRLSFNLCGLESRLPRSPVPSNNVSKLCHVHVKFAEDLRRSGVAERQINKGSADFLALAPNLKTLDGVASIALTFLTTFVSLNFWPH